MKMQTEIHNSAGRCDERDLDTWRTLLRIRRRFDPAALEQIRAEVTRLATENDRLRERLGRAEDDGEFWRREATEAHLQLCDLEHTVPGLTVDGQVVRVPPEK